MTFTGLLFLGAAALNLWLGATHDSALNLVGGVFYALAGVILIGADID